MKSLFENLGGTCIPGKDGMHDFAFSPLLDSSSSLKRPLFTPQSGNRRRRALCHEMPGSPQKRAGGVHHWAGHILPASSDDGGHDLSFVVVSSWYSFISMATQALSLL